MYLVMNMDFRALIKRILQKEFSCNN
uniref:Uncharacterized protein n=1 Tax=Anguilla anguilla TaxID=7936 RepID=A0A0E9V736_ANGAN